MLRITKAQLKVLACLLSVLLPIGIAQPSKAEAGVRVKGYYRSDGKYVREHYRTSPDKNFWNNWSSKGNVNPYTGKRGDRTYDQYLNGKYKAPTYYYKSTSRGRR